MTLSPRQLLPVKRRLLLGPSWSVSGRLVTENTSWGRVEVKHQREDGLAGNVVELDLAPAEVLSSSERVDFTSSEGPLRGGGVVVRVLNVDFPSRFAGEDVRLAAAEPNVPSGSGGFGGDFIVLAAQRVQSFEALDLLTLKKETRLCEDFTYNLN